MLFVSKTGINLNVGIGVHIGAIGIYGVVIGPNVYILEQDPDNKTSYSTAVHELKHKFDESGGVNQNREKYYLECSGYMTEIIYGGDIKKALDGWIKQLQRDIKRRETPPQVRAMLMDWIGKSQDARNRFAQDGDEDAARRWALKTYNSQTPKLPSLDEYNKEVLTRLREEWPGTVPAILDLKAPIAAGAAAGGLMRNLKSSMTVKEWAQKRFDWLTGKGRLDDYTPDEEMAREELRLFFDIDITEDRDEHQRLWQNMVFQNTEIIEMPLDDFISRVHSGERRFTLPEKILLSDDWADSKLPPKIDRLLKIGREKGIELEFFVVEVFGKRFCFASIGDDICVSGFTNLLMYGPMQFHKRLFVAHNHHEKSYLPSEGDVDIVQYVDGRRAFLSTGIGLCEYGIIERSMEHQDAWVDAVREERIRICARLEEEKSRGKDTLILKDPIGCEAIYRPSLTMADSYSAFQSASESELTDDMPSEGGVVIEGVRVVQEGEPAYEPASSNTSLHNISYGCIICAAFNTKTGERRTAHFLPEEHRDSLPADERDDTFKLTLALGNSLKTQLGEISGPDWNVAVVSIDEPGYLDDRSRRMTMGHVHGYLVNQCNIPQSNIVKDEGLKEGVDGKSVIVDRNGKVTLSYYTREPRKREHYRTIDLARETKEERLWLDEMELTGEGYEALNLHLLQQKLWFDRRTKDLRRQEIARIETKAQELHARLETPLHTYARALTAIEEGDIADEKLSEVIDAHEKLAELTEEEIHPEFLELEKGGDPTGWLYAISEELRNIMMPMAIHIRHYQQKPDASKEEFQQFLKTQSPRLYGIANWLYRLKEGLPTLPKETLEKVKKGHVEDMGLYLEGVYNQVNRGPALDRGIFGAIPNGEEFKKKPKYIIMISQERIVQPVVRERGAIIKGVAAIGAIRALLAQEGYGKVVIVQAQNTSEAKAFIDKNNASLKDTFIYYDDKTATAQDVMSVCPDYMLANFDVRENEAFLPLGGLTALAIGAMWIRSGRELDMKNIYELLAALQNKEAGDIEREWRDKNWIGERAVIAFTSGRLRIDPIKVEIELKKAYEREAEFARAL